MIVVRGPELSANCLYFADILNCVMNRKIFTKMELLISKNYAQFLI